MAMIFGRESLLEHSHPAGCGSCVSKVAVNNCSADLLFEYGKVASDHVRGLYMTCQGIVGQGKITQTLSDMLAELEVWK